MIDNNINRLELHSFPKDMRLNATSNTSMQVKNSHANDIVNFDFYENPSWHGFKARHLVQDYYMPQNVIIFTYGNEQLDLRENINFLNTLNCYWIYVPTDNIEKVYNTPLGFGEIGIPEPSTFVFCVLFLFMFLFRCKNEKGKKA